MPVRLEESSGFVEAQRPEGHAIKVGRFADGLQLRDPAHRQPLTSSQSNTGTLQYPSWFQIPLRQLLSFSVQKKNCLIRNAFGHH